MEHLKLSAQVRETTGKKVRQLRRDGLIPVIVYGGALKDSLSLQIPERELTRTLSKAGGTTLIDLQVDGKSYPVLARSVQRDTTRHTLMHVDFLSVRLDQPIQAEIPVVAINESPIVETNEAVLVLGTTTVTVEALPENLPSQLEADLSILTNLDVNVLASDLKLGRGITLITDPETVLFAVTPPVIEVEPEPEVEEAEEGAEDEAEGEEGEADSDESAQDEDEAAS